MLQIALLDSNGALRRGGAELLEEWHREPASFLWVDLYREDADQEERLMRSLGLHPLAIKDAQRERHPPKLEVFDDHLFILLRGLDAETEGLDFGTVQIALFAGPRFLLTRHDKKSVSINHWWTSPELTASLKQGGIRLALEISTTAARRYLDLMLEFEPHLADLEDQLQESPDDKAMLELTYYRTRLRKLKRIFNYHTRVFDTLRGVKTDFFNAGGKEARHVVLDVYEKYERLQSLCTMHYELAGDLVEGYISLTNHQLNNTMRVLTVLTAIFVPLTFIAGIYGMNFEYMPELGWRWGYFSLLAIMAVVMVVLVGVFRRIRWL
jgi:magnesium transporter